MFPHRYLLLNFFVSLFSVGAKAQMPVKPPSGIIRILTSGLPDFERMNSESVVAKKWGIEFYGVAGCISSVELDDSVKRYNEVSEKLVVKKYGKDWRTRFYKEVNDEYEKEKLVTALVDSLGYIKVKNAELQREGNGLHYIMKPVNKAALYEVSVQGWGAWEGKDAWLTYYKLLVDYKAKTTKMVSSQLVKEWTN